MTKDFKVSISLAAGSFVLYLLGFFIFISFGRSNTSEIFTIQSTINYVLAGVLFLIIEYLCIVIWAISKTKK